jgi:hypothetical protein
VHRRDERVLRGVVRLDSPCAELGHDVVPRFGFAVHLFHVSHFCTPMIEVNLHTYYLAAAKLHPAMAPQIAGFSESQSPETLGPKF